MRTKVIPVKLTPTEDGVLDWLMQRLYADSRSQVLRRALLELAERQGINSAELKRARDDRRIHRPRRSIKVTRLIGHRQRKDPLPEECA